MAALLVTERSAEVADALSALALKQTSTSALRHAIDGFIVRMINNGLMSPTSDWLDSLPRVLWELGGANEVASQTLLTFLLRFGQKTPLETVCQFSMCLYF